MDFDWADILIPLSALLMGLYALALVLIFLYAITQLSLLFNYLRNKNKEDQSPKFDLNKPKEVPHVTVQLPVYNELYVIERLLDHVAEMEYPKDKFEVQVLDDSTDESVALTAKRVAELQEKGLNIVHVRRKDRTGFKAGALKAGLETAKGDFVAIFDADFIPGTDWLLKTVPYFKDDKVGVVQTRWGHINKNQIEGWLEPNSTVVVIEDLVCGTIYVDFCTLLNTNIRRCTTCSFNNCSGRDGKFCRGTDYKTSA